MPQAEFEALVSKIADKIKDHPLNDGLADYLNSNFPKDGDDFMALSALCAEGERDGWLMAREVEGIKFSRPVKPGGVAGNFSVDVVRMKNVKGPHHIHPNGEIGAVMALEGAPKFDVFPEGWYVYEAGTEHHPTITDGDAYVLYLLPDGAIEFTGK